MRNVRSPAQKPPRGKNGPRYTISVLFRNSLTGQRDIWITGGGAHDSSARDYLYISLVNYTTLGYGEIVPTGHLRTICGFEALIGLLMVGWTTAFTVFRLTDRWKANLD